MVKRIRLARRLAIYIILILVVMMVLINGTIILIMELRLQKLSQEASEEYLQAKIQSMDVSTYQFVQSFDHLVGSLKSELNNTAFTIANKFYSSEAKYLYEHSFLVFNNSDQIAYINGTIDMDVDREISLGYYDYDGNGINDFETTGCSVFGDIESQLTFLVNFIYKLTQHLRVSFLMKAVS
ncbi:MAG: hypothetical protein ACTSSN_05665 [Candidatus Heimdallarchaeaceae archaeon]